MQSDWPIVPVADCCDLIVDCVNKTAPVVESTTPFKMIRTTNVRNGFIDLSDCKFVDEATFRTWTRRASVLDGDVVLTREAPIGEVGLVRGNRKIFLGQRLMQYRANRALLDPRFLCYAFLSPQLQHQFGAHEGSGSVVSHIRVGDCSKFKIPLPPLSMQQAIAGLLGAIDERVLLLRQTNATLESIAQALFKSWFIDFDPVRAKAEGREPEGMDAATAALFPAEFEESALGVIPKGWHQRTIEELADRIGMGPFGSNIKVSTFVDAGVPVLTGACLKGTLLEDDDFRYITEEHAARLAGSLVGPGDIVITHRGTLGQVSLVAEGAQHKKYVLSQSQFFLRANRAASTPEFLTYFLRSDLGQHLLLANAAQVGVPSISRPVTYLKSIRLIAPPQNVARAFSDLITPLHLRMVSGRQRIESLSHIRDALIPRLISGKLRLPEAQEQLADALA